MTSQLAQRAHHYLAAREQISPERLGVLLECPDSADGAPLMGAIGSLVNGRVVDPEQAHKAWAHANSWVYVDPADRASIPNSVIDMVPAQVARDENVLPYRFDQATGLLWVASPHPSNAQAKRIQGHAGVPVRVAYAPDAELRTVVDAHYSTSAEAVKVGRAAAQAVTVSSGPDLSGVREQSEIETAVNVIIEGALRAGASDIHIEPGADSVSVRYSVNGRIIREPAQPREIAVRLAQVIKSRASLDPSSLRNQDGVLSHAYDGRLYDLRVAVLPAQYGESITLRLGQQKTIPLEEIGFADDTQERWRRALAQPNGLLLAVGPMGSGKTNLHYSSLQVLLGQERKIVSLESPVELKMRAGITQVSINEAQGVTWDSAMPTVLRSAASVLFIGEINHREIAQTAAEAAMTGHLVLATLHTNDAPGAVVRLREMGIGDSVLADTLRAVCAQRLPARLCQACRVQVRPSEDNVLDFRLTGADLSPDTQWWGPSQRGCAECAGTGFKGRLAIHELMTFPRHVRDLVLEGAPTGKLGEAAKSAGMHTLIEDGLAKARQGLTSLDELRRHLIID